MNKSHYGLVGTLDTRTISPARPSRHGAVGELACDKYERQANRQPKQASSHGW